MTSQMATRTTLRTLVRAWSRPLVLGGLLTGSLLLPPGTARSAPPASQTIHTARPKFRIPFQFDAEEMARLGAVEIRLFVSTDRGRHWQHAQSVAPGEGRFTFEATSEGEFWFAVRTVDGNGQLHPPGPPQSGLQVVVDQTQPQINIRVREVRPGEVELTWQASDDNLDVNTLALEFLDPGATDWQAVNVTPAESGQTTWTVASTGRVFVRATVSDRAGNSATAEATTGEIGGAPAQPAGQPNNNRPDFSRPVAGPPAASQPNVALDEAPVVIPDGGDLLTPLAPGPVATSVTSRTVSGPNQTPVVVESPEAFRPDAAAPDTATSPVATRHVRTRSFSVQYELEDVGPSGVSSVDLYITENNGFKWFYYGPDEDRRSPIAVEVPRDGAYGFALRVRSGAGLVQEPPQPGDSPAFVVIVDRQPPQAELGRVAAGQGADRDEINIEWTVRDEQLVARPVRLSWAPAREGPWRPITDWIPNSGRYQWQVDEQALTSVFLRLEARDAAGNLTRTDSTTPLVLDSSRPTARFTDIESASPAIPQ